jgi:hypothetical protein
MEPVSTTIAVASAATALFSAVQGLYKKGDEVVKDVRKHVDNFADAGNVSLPSYTKPLRLCSRVYIDDSIYADPSIPDVIKTIHTQYAGLILTALQLNRFVVRDRTVQDMLRVVATEDNKIHDPVVESLFGPKIDEKRPGPLTKEEQGHVDEQKERDRREALDKVNPIRSAGKDTVVSLAGDNHVPAGKLLEITLANPENPSATVTLNLMVQLAPYRVPAQLAVQMITKDVIPTFFQRYLQWRTGEISFWRDFVAMSDIVERRAKLMKMDPTGILADHIGKQTQGREKVLANINKHKADRARNLANSVLIFSRETIQRARAETGVDVTASSIDMADPGARQKFFATSFAMMMVVVDPLYNQVTFYYNGLDDSATFSFDQLQVGGKGGGGLDLVSVMNALGQGRSPKF